MSPLSISGPLNAVANHRAHFLAHLWKITREDGTFFLFTDADTQIVYDDGAGNQTYEPAGAWSTSAVRREEGLADQEAEGRGMVSSTAITYGDLEAGLFREAEVIESLIDPRFPWAGAFYVFRYWITDTRFDGEKWNAEIIGTTSWLSQRSGRAMTRTCNADVFDDRCGIATTDETWYEESGAIVATFDSVEPRRIFTFTLASLPGGVGAEETEYKHGKVTWTSGLNAGIVSEIKEYAHTGAEPLQRDVELTLPTPYAIAATDQATVVTGCDRTASTCDRKFGNILNHRGHPTMPGTDDAIRVPDVPSA